MADRLFPDYTLIVELAIFLVILLVLSKYLFKPYLKIMKERHRLIQGSHQESKELRSKVDAMLGDYDSKIKDARRESAKVLEDMKKEGEEISRDIVAKAKSESDKKFEENKKRIWEEAKELEKKLEKTSREVADELTSKILK